MEEYLSEKSHRATQTGSILALVAETAAAKPGQLFLNEVHPRATKQEHEWEVTPICPGEQGEDRKGHLGGLPPNLHAAQE